MSVDAIGVMELNSIAAGIQIVDTMLKAAEVELVLARTICSGKYLIIVAGEVAAARASVESGIDFVEGTVIDHTVIPRVHQSILPAVSGINKTTTLKSIGIIESFSVCSLLEAADAAVKAAHVDIIETRLAMALGGKAFVSLTGDVSAVRTAVDTGADIVARKGLLVFKAVIPAPAERLYRDYI